MDKPSESSIARKTLRGQLLALRAGLSDAERAQSDTLLCQQLLQADPLQTADTIGVYSPIQGEPDLSACYEHWRAQGRRLALPVVAGRDQPLLFRIWDASVALRTGAFGVSVPETGEMVVPDVLVIPCVGFSIQEGRPYRLGYGGGFYDRTLAAHAYRSIGVAYDQAETASFMINVWDRPLSMLLTPSRCMVAMASP